MQFPRLFMLLAGTLVPLTAAAQSLVCPTAPAGRPCDAFHYHVSMYRPDNRTFAEVYAPAPFATTAACERARQQQVDANEKVVAFFRDVKEQKYPPDRFGPCHCDMSTERSSATYLTDQQRIAQLRTAEEIRLRVRERLLDNKVASNAEVILGLYAEPPSTPALAMQKVVPPPQTSAVAVSTSPDDLHPTLTLETSKPSVAALDLPLIAASGEEPLPPIRAVTAATIPPPAPIEETRVDTQATVETDETPEAETAEEQQSAEETAERFVSYETQRIQNVLRASGSIADENVKTRIFEAAMERIQLLSNLRAIIEGSGSGSRLASAARDVLTEDDRVKLVARIFGQDIRSHWAPKDASDVVFEIDSAIAAAPERVLRDNSGTYTAEQKKHALYVVLAKTQPTEDQRLWLSTVVEGFLR
jgi:hypothetical protein